MKWITALLFIQISVLAAGWEADFDKTLQTAAARKRPVLLDFSAAWCGPCQFMARTTLQDSAVAQKLDSFLKLKVDIDENAALAERFGVHAVPTFIVVNGEGEELVRTSGAESAADFSEWLNGALSTAAMSETRKEEFAKSQQTLTRDLKSGDAVVRTKAIGTLLDYSFRKEKYCRDFAAANFQSAAHDDPLLLLGLLNHEKLAVRIMAANLLRDALGPDFNFDPWASATVRIAIIDKWKARLATGRN